ncbi:hypothetical protein [Cellvibrio sp.]|uniref:hypothetical protein n=1 Tax=Cellvibrio sp. TaxID=1965322 RepID=UPI00396486B2
MVIGEFTGYSAYGTGANYAQRSQVQARPAVTLEAERDPQIPHQYRVAATAQVIPPVEPATEAKSGGKKAPQNNDPVSRAFLAVANYQPSRSRIDIKV